MQHENLLLLQEKNIKSVYFDLEKDRFSNSNDFLMTNKKTYSTIQTLFLKAQLLCN